MDKHYQAEQQRLQSWLLKQGAKNILSQEAQLLLDAVAHMSAHTARVVEGQVPRIQHQVLSEQCTALVEPYVSRVILAASVQEREIIPAGTCFWHQNYCYSSQVLQQFYPVTVSSVELCGNKLVFQFYHSQTDMPPPKKLQLFCAGSPVNVDAWLAAMVKVRKDAIGPNDQAFNILIDFNEFPERFNFIEVECDKNLAAEIPLDFIPNEPMPQFILNCFPAINHFPLQCDPVELHSMHDDIVLSADGKICSIKKVVVSTQGQSAILAEDCYQFYPKTQRLHLVCRPGVVCVEAIGYDVAPPRSLSYTTQLENQYNLSVVPMMQPTRCIHPDAKLSEPVYRYITDMNYEDVFAWRALFSLLSLSQSRQLSQWIRAVDTIQSQHFSRFKQGILYHSIELRFTADLTPVQCRHLGWIVQYYLEHKVPQYDYDVCVYPH